ncbi:MAG: hypothetical protein DDG60_01695 [Anaerolineae bacterium]|nr:MAG: hypothetical protein DDG60_01695 [Anaerolineae bacterium]
MSEHIHYERTGGFAGLKLSVRFDLEDLPEEQAEQLRELLDDLEFFDLPEQILPTRPVADQFTYKIEVQTKKGHYSVRTTDSAAPPKLRELISLLNLIARTYLKRD